MARQFSQVSCKYGAPMGRAADGFLECGLRRFVRLFRVRLDSGGYDDGGAYWGHGSPLWCAIDGDGSRQFIRAGSREYAALCLGIPPAALKKPLANAQGYALAVIDGRSPMPEGITQTDVLDWLASTGVAMGRPA